MSNYQDVWQTLIADKQKSWVLFENGTCVVLPQPDHDLSEQAKTVLAPYAEEIVGSSMGDFSVLLLEDYPGWIIGSDHPDILNYVAPEDVSADTNDMLVGLTGRQQRSDDAQQLKIIYIQDQRPSKR